MNILQKAARWAFQKAVGFPSWNTVGGWPAGWLSGQGGVGEPMELAAVYGCCRVLCQTEGSVPCNVWIEDPRTGVRTKAVDHWSYKLLHDSPNDHMTSMEFREAMILGFCLFGNGYAEIAKIGRRVTSLNPLRADRMRPMFLPPDYDRLIYRYSHLNGKTEDYEPEDIIHLRNFSLDGLVGISPIRKHVMDHALDAQSYGRNFFKNSGRPSGVLTSDQSPPANTVVGDKMRADWDTVFASPSNSGKTAVLWKGLKYEAISVPPEDAQYIQTRQLGAADIAAIYGVPLNMLAQSDKTATYASAEQFDIQFVKHTVRPLAVRLEQAINKRLFANEPGVFCELDLDGLQRGDSKTQAEYFSALAGAGIMSRDEARRKLNLPEVGGGAGRLTVQGANVFLDDLGKQKPQPAAAGGAQP